jgi:hypothetical protein
MICFVCHKDLRDVSHGILDEHDKYPFFRGGDLTTEGLKIMDVKHYCFEHELLLMLSTDQMASA